jgi:transposase
LLQFLHDQHAHVSLVWADGGYTGLLIEWALATLTLTVAVVKRADDTSGFTVLPRRWVVERTLSWICRRRRCVRDYERLPAHHLAMVTWSMTILMTRRLARRAGRSG